MIKKTSFFILEVFKNFQKLVIVKVKKCEKKVRQFFKFKPRIFFFSLSFSSKPKWKIVKDVFLIFLALFR